LQHRNSQRLINDILDLEKIAAGKLTFAHAWVAMRDLALEAIEANQPFAQERNVVVVLEPGPAVAWSSDTATGSCKSSPVLSNASVDSPF
jgi:signal transduction histidine kinase